MLEPQRARIKKVINHELITKKWTVIKYPLRVPVEVKEYQPK
jgi:hypothetical protein